MGVYNTLSFALASMMATTMYLWFRSTAVHDKYKSAVLTSGLVTFIAAYHYIRIFLYIVQELLVGLSEATELETNREVKDKIKTAQVVTVISWCTYPVVYLFPMLGISASKAVVGIQVGYCASDIISKCGVGLFIYQIS